MREKEEKHKFGLYTVQKIAGAFEGLVARIKHFGDILERLSLELKRFNDIQEGVLAPDSDTELEKLTPKKPKRAGTSTMRIPEVLHRSIFAISRKKPEFTVNEVIDHAVNNQRFIQETKYSYSLSGVQSGIQNG